MMAQIKQALAIVGTVGGNHHRGNIQDTAAVLDGVKDLSLDNNPHATIFNKYGTNSLFVPYLL